MIGRIFNAICYSRHFSFVSKGKPIKFAMATDTCTRNLENIKKHLIEFENKPKKIDGNKILDWFNVGENLFVAFYHLGNSVKWNSSEIKKLSIVKNIVVMITENQGWLQSFITIYPGLRIDLEGSNPAVNICRVRSGIEFLLQNFSGINENFDKVLKDLKELGELEEFDDHLKIWKEGHRPNFFPGDKSTDTPKSHWWWF